MSVYDPEAFAERVNYLTACCIRGTDSRQRDTCLEMNDGTVVAVAVYRRSLNNPRLAACIWKTLARETVLRDVATLWHVPTRQLVDEARRQRAGIYPPERVTIEGSAV